MMRLVARPATVSAGVVSLWVLNTGAMAHEVVVLRLPSGQGIGERPIGPDGKVNEAGSLGEASRSCGTGEGDGIAPGTMAWTTLTLRPGRYELVCNLPGHYLAGMYTELDVTDR
ncbi:sulfocyanin-like copper-binding protein [Streptomyces brasiliensis]|nr:sulfocyanin-like copper-binding protein [Streptomyces brasiliensis]